MIRTPTTTNHDRTQLLLAFTTSTPFVNTTFKRRTRIRERDQQKRKIHYHNVAFCIVDISITLSTFRCNITSGWRSTSSSSSVFVVAQTSCPSSMNLTQLSGPKPSPTATFLDIDITCIYQQFANDTYSYQFVPLPFIRVEPGDAIGFYSNPPDIYDTSRSTE